jgi:hypothetical protein
MMGLSIRWDVRVAGDLELSVPRCGTRYDVHLWIYNHQHWYKIRSGERLRSVRALLVYQCALDQWHGVAHRIHQVLGSHLVVT